MRKVNDYVEIEMDETKEEMKEVGRFVGDSGESFDLVFEDDPVLGVILYGVVSYRDGAPVAKAGIEEDEFVFFGLGEDIRLPYSKGDSLTNLRLQVLEEDDWLDYLRSMGEHCESRYPTGIWEYISLIDRASGAYDWWRSDCHRPRL